MGTCVLTPKAKNGLPSILWKSLESYFNKDRSKVKESYAVASNESIISKAEDVGIEINRDVNGEITLGTYINIINSNDSKQKLLEYLNKEYGTVRYDSLDSCLSAVKNFNTNKEYNESFIATVERLKNNEWKISIVPNTLLNKFEFKEVIRKLKLAEIIKETLSHYNVAVDFIEETGRSRYSTENIDKAADDMYHLISVSKGEDIEKSLAEEAGHFAFGAMSNNALYDRLLNLIGLLDIEFAQNMLGSLVTKLTPEIKKEIAGQLIGIAILSQTLNREKYKESIIPYEVANIANRLWNFAKRIFSRMPFTLINHDRLKAESIAFNIASQFLNYNDSIQLENALRRKETLYETNSLFSSISANYKNAMTSLRDLSTILGTLDIDLETRVNKIIDRIENANENILNVDESTSSKMITDTDVNSILGVSAIALMLHEYKGLITDVLPEKFKTVEEGINSTSNLFLNMHTYGTILRECRAILELVVITSNALSLSLNILKMTGSEYLLDNKVLIEGTWVDLSKDLDDIETHINKNSYVNSIHLLQQYETILFSKFLEYANNDPYIYKDASIMYTDKKTRKSKNLKFWHLITTKEALKLSMVLLLDILDDDEGLLGYITPLSDSKDPVNCLLAHITDMSKNAATQKSVLDMNRINELERIYREDLHLKDEDMVKFFEKDFNGNLTGNYISLFNYAEFEKAIKEERKGLYLEFLYNNKDKLEKMTYSQRKHLFEHEYKEELSIIYKKYTDKDGHPESMFLNEDYKALTEEEKKFLDLLILFKQEKDSLLNHEVRWYRAPQIVGRKRVTKYNKGNSALKLFKDTASEFLDNFRTTANDIEFGVESIDSTDEEVRSIDSELYNELKELSLVTERMPIRYVNKLADMDRLNTDLFGGLIAYSDMSNRYETLSKIKDLAIMGRDVLGRTRDRKLNPVGNKWYSKKFKSLSTLLTGFNINSEVPMARKMYDDYILNRILSARKPLKIGDFNLEKALGAFKGFCSKMALRFNFAGAAVNTGTGVVLIFKEAFTGLHFDLKLWMLANKFYISNLPTNVKNTGVLGKTDKLSLFLREMDFRGDNSQSFREYTSFNGAIDRIGSFILHEGELFAYSSGDHYMQSMSYIMSALGTKLYDINGKEISLLDSYNLFKISDSKNGMILVSAFTKEDDSQSLEEYIKEINDLKNFLQKYKRLNFLTKGKGIAGIPRESFTERELELLDKYLNLYGRDDAIGGMSMLILKATTFFKTKEGALYFSLLQEILNKFTYLDKDKHIANIAVTPEEEEALSYIGIKSEDLGASFTEAIDKSIVDRIKVGIENLIWNERDKNDYMLKCREINIRMHGIYNDSDKVLMQNYVLTSMMLLMKGYALGYIADKFYGTRYNARLKTMTEGYMSTAFKLMALLVGLSDPKLRLDSNFFTRFINITVLPIIACFGSSKAKTRLEKVMKDRGFSNYLVANSRRIIAHLLVRFLLQYLYSLCTDDDDDMEAKLEKMELKNRFYKDNYAKEWLAKNEYKCKNKTENEIDLMIEHDRNLEYLRDHPFNFKGICRYIIKRMINELDAFDISIFLEVRGLLSLPIAFTMLIAMSEIAYYFYKYAAAGEYINPNIPKYIKDLKDNEEKSRLTAEYKEAVAKNNNGAYYDKTVLGLYTKGDPKAFYKAKKYGYDFYNPIGLIYPWSRSEYFLLDPDGALASYEKALESKY